jgi:NitT/TauT family transport system ATP-binding protein
MAEKMSSNGGRSGEVLLRFENVWKYYEKDDNYIQALAGVNLEIYKNEFLCVIGPSSSGKSTMLKLIAGLDKPSVGSVTLKGKKIEKPGHDRGMIFQEYSMLPWRSVEKNIELGLEFANEPLKKRKEVVKKYLDMVGLGYAKNKHPWELSGGMKRRTTLAMILAIAPEILLMDGAFNALDAKTKMTMQNEIVNIWQREGNTIIFVTSELDEAVKLSDRIVILTHGGGVASVIENPLPRPRSGKVATTPEFTRMSAAVRENILDILVSASKKKVVV